jgi:3-oxoacyl-[acyl-carrier protein] reductase
MTLTDLLSLHGEIALVTGASRGIGRAIALLLARAGAFVACNFRSDEAGARTTLDTILNEGFRGSLEQFDVTDLPAVERSVARIQTDVGPVSILVNNAGVSRDGLVGRMSDSDWNQVIKTNLSGAFFLCRTVSKGMIRHRKGRIVNITSTAGEAGNAGQANYSAAKAGLIGLTRALARELAPRNILVNAVSPGIVAGGLTEKLTEEQLESLRAHVPLRKMGTAEDVATAVLFLCSGMAQYVTGQVIRVNGGLYM